ncbi:hypothetical protein ACIPY1_05125 [Paenarthrobacter nicotinovorans]
MGATFDGLEWVGVIRCGKYFGELCNGLGTMKAHDDGGWEVAR